MTRLLVLLIFWVWVASAGAEQVVDLYRAEELVTSQSESERRAAARRALAELMQRVSGDPRAAEHQLVADAVARAQDYLYEYNYASTRETVDVDGEPVPASRLVMKFSPTAVEDLLRSAGLPLWPANRPSVLVWLAARDGDGVHLAGDEEARNQVRTEARKRGLPVILPLQDLEDRLALSARQLWNMDQSAIRQASRRYQTDSILVGRYSVTSLGEWRSNWQLYHPMGNIAFTLDSSSVSDILAQSLAYVAEHFAGLYAIIPQAEGPDTAIVQLAAVSDFGAYQQAQRYLDGLAMVRRSELVALRPDALTLRLYIEGDLQRFLSTLELDRRLLPSAQSDTVTLPEHRFLPRGTLVNPLLYTWQN